MATKSWKGRTVQLNEQRKASTLGSPDKRTGVKAFASRKVLKEAKSGMKTG